MGLSFAIDELVATGWSGLDTSGCHFDTDGRSYPTIARVRQEFAAAGFELTISKSDSHGCHRAVWREAGQGEDSGAVVGACDAEAAVFALAHLRRTLVAG